MRILIDIGHPAHVHLFRQFALMSQNAGDHVLFTYRDRYPVKELLRAYRLNAYRFGPHYKKPLAKMAGLLRYNAKMLQTCRSFKPDILLSHGSMYAAQISRVIRKPHISFEDTFNMEQIKLYLPFTDLVLTGMYEHRNLGYKELRYPGYHELAYLHPNLFTPDESVLSQLGVHKGERYAIVRFVGWNASHDIGHKGMSAENKVRLVKALAEKIKVFVSSETDLPDDLRQYGIRIPPETMLDALFYAHLFVGESATMASECAVLGVPAVYINNAQLGYTNEQQFFGLVHSYTESLDQQLMAIGISIELAQDIEAKTGLRENWKNMMKDKIDVSAFLFWLIHEYPESVEKARSSNFSFDVFRTSPDALIRFD